MLHGSPVFPSSSLTFKTKPKSEPTVVAFCVRGCRHRCNYRIFNRICLPNRVCSRPLPCPCKPPPPQKKTSKKAPPVNLRLSRHREPSTHFHPLTLHARAHTCRSEPRLEETTPAKCGNGAHHTPHMNVSAEACMHAHTQAGVFTLACWRVCMRARACMPLCRRHVCMCVCTRAHVSARENFVQYSVR